MDEDSFRIYGGPGWFGVVVTSLLISLGVAGGVLWAVQHGHIQLSVPVAKTDSPDAQSVPAQAQGINVKVPTIVGLPGATASELLTARGLRPIVRERRESTLPVDSVIAQSPLADSLVPHDSPVTVILSSGPPPNVKVPELVGKSLTEAQSVLDAAGLKLGKTTGPAAGDRIVTASQPAPGASVAEESSVDLTVELGGIEVPKLTGLSFGKAKKLLESLGLGMGKVRERYDEETGPYVILQQSPEPGMRVAPASTIDVVRNEGD